MSAVKKAISGATSFLVGGDTTKETAFADMTQEEQKRLQEIEGSINQLYGQQSQQDPSTDLFRQALTHFMAGGSSNPNPTPEQLQQATSFVDQTFTNPSQVALDQYNKDFTSQAQAQAAAMGRNPNLDIATQQAIQGEIARQGLGLQAERGARIQQAARDLNDTGYARGLQQLKAGMQGSNFLNSLGQQAFANRIGLLNQRTGLADMFQRERQVGKYGTTSGALTNLTSIGKGMNDFQYQFWNRPIQQTTSGYTQMMSGGLGGMGGFGGIGG